MVETQLKNIHGLPLLRDPDSKNKFHFLEDIYMGDLDDRRATTIPNVGDFVLDRTNKSLRWLECVFVDEITLIPELVEITDETNRNDFSKDNQLLGVGPGYQSETWRLFVDKSVTPFVFAVDSRLNIYGKENTKYKIFMGTDVSQTNGTVISLNFNNNGELLSEDLPLEKVAFASTDRVDTNIAVKHPRKGFTNHDLNNGDVVTLVTYTEEGHATSYNTLLVHNTALDRNVESSRRYITSISIDSPFLDKTENNTLVFPSNIPRDALAMMGIVTYSDGTSRKLPIDGNRFVLHGLDNYVTMKQGQDIKLVLKYNMSSDELALNAINTDQRFITVKYFGRTLKVDGSYSVNLFPIPTYVSDNYGWKINYMLYTMDRDVAYDVTKFVRNGANTPLLQPLLYNDIQDITVSLDLSKVNPTLRKFIHVQSYKIAFVTEPGPDCKTAWYITYEKDQDPQYGANVICKAIKDPGLNRWTLDVSCGAGNLDEWLDRLYYRIKPIYDNYSETKPPRPTHFTINIDDTRVSYPIKAWNQVITFPTGAYDGYGVMITWTRIEGNKQYELGASPLCFIDISEHGVIDHAGTTATAEDLANKVNDATIVDIDTEVQRIQDRGASMAVIELYRRLLERVKRYQLLRYKQINDLYQQIRTRDITPAQIANDVMLLEIEVNAITISDFNRNTDSNSIAPMSMENQRP